MIIFTIQDSKHKILLVLTVLIIIGEFAAIIEDIAISLFHKRVMYFQYARFFMALIQLSPYVSKRKQFRPRLPQGNN